MRQVLTTCTSFFSRSLLAGAIRRGIARVILMKGIILLP